jgi:hypothetical protein
VARSLRAETLCVKYREPNMTIFRARLKKDFLVSLPEEERKLFLALGHIGNEINALHKLILWSSDFSSDNQAVLHGKISFSLMFVRFLAGKLKEAHKLITQRFLSAPVGKAYEAELSPEGRQALDNIKRYFGRQNIIDQVRNSFAFHYSPDAIDSVLPGVSDELDLYLGDDGGANTLYYFSEVLANMALLDAMGETDLASAMGRLIADVLAVAKSVLNFAEAFMARFVEKHSPDVWDGFAEPVSVDDLQSIRSISLPWFTDSSTLSELLAEINQRKKENGP